LTECALDVLVARGGEEALKLASSTTVRLVLLLLPLPGMAAHDTCARIRLLPNYAAVPILLLGNPPDAAEREAAKRAGVTRLLSLPVSIIGLKQAVLPLLGGAAPRPVSAMPWKRRPDPTPAFGETRKLAQAPRLLEIYRRGRVSRSTRTDWIR
jgi:CheY-like chemotaxis protein